MPSVFDLLTSVCDGALRPHEPARGDGWFEVDSARLVEVCTALRDHPDLAFDFFSSVTAVDYFSEDPKAAAKLNGPPRLELVYHLLSTQHRLRVVLKAILPRWQDDVPGRLPIAPSVSKVWAGADWHEREVFDLFGVYFEGHPNLVRILCVEDWEGHPLRKDYVMPLEYQGMRGR